MLRFALVLVLLLPVSQDSLRDLESADPVVARQAFNALVRRGDEGALIEAAARSDRAKSALAEIRAHRRFGEAYPPSAPLSFEAKNRPTRELLEELGNALKLRFVPEKAGPGVILEPLQERMTLSLRESYPLEAMEAVGRSLDSMIYVRDGEAQIFRGSDPRSYRVEQPHFSIAMESYQEERGRDLLGATQSEAFLRMKVRHDWLCRMVGMKGIQLLAVEDDLGEDLHLEHSGDRADYGDVENLSTQVLIKVPNPEATKLKKVKGVFSALFPERPASAELLIGGAVRELRLPNMMLTLEKSSENGAEMRIAGKIPDLQKAYVLPEPREFSVKGKTEERIAGKGTRSGQNDSPVWELTFEVPKGFVVSTLTVKYFEGVGEHQIPFELRDVPIR